MILLALGCSFRTTPVAVRERLAFNDEQLTRALDTLNGKLGYEAVILSTCNRVELYLGRVLGNGPAPLEGEGDIIDFLAEHHGLPPAEVRPHLYVHRHAAAVTHLFRVAASLDSMLVGEGQIAGQVNAAYERALRQSSTGPLLNLLFPHANRVAKRVRTETGISAGRVSVSSAAVEYVREVFDHFGDKTILVIGAGKMGELTLKHLKGLRPGHILVTNRSPEKAAVVAQGCGGEAVPWAKLDEVLARADIVLSTTGAPEPIVSAARWRGVLSRRHALSKGPAVILDIAVPRDFDPAIHDGDRTFLFNIDDLKTIREATLARRREHIGPGEHIVEQEVGRFLKEWARRRNGPVIDCLTRDFEAKRREVVKSLFARLNGKLSEEDRKSIEKAFSLLQNQFLHGPISALAEEASQEAGHGAHGGHGLLDAVRKLFRLKE
jgi:glutamyl-tRNA reductase